MKPEVDPKKLDQRRIIQIAHDNGWPWWYDNEDKLIIDCSGMREVGEKIGDEEENDCC